MINETTGRAELKLLVARRQLDDACLRVCLFVCLFVCVCVCVCACVAKTLVASRLNQL